MPSKARTCPKSRVEKVTGCDCDHALLYGSQHSIMYIPLSMSAADLASQEEQCDSQNCIAQQKGC
eukprot:1141531-Rhodomonas_salina.1